MPDALVTAYSIIGTYRVSRYNYRLKLPASFTKQTISVHRCKHLFGLLKFGF